MRLDSNPRCCSPFPQPQPLSFRRCTHKLAEVWNHEALGRASTSFTHPFALPPRRCHAGCRQTKWYALFLVPHPRNSFSQRPPAFRLQEIVKGILAGAHTCSRAGPQTQGMYVHKTDLPPSIAQMILPCCFGRAWASPPTARTRRFPRTSWTPSSTAPASATSGATSTLSITKTPMCARPLACDHTLCFCLIPSLVLYSEHSRRGRPLGRRRLAIRRLLGDSAAQRHGRGAGPGSTTHKGVLPRYASNSRGQFPSRSPW